MKKVYELYLVCEYENKQEKHSLFIGSLNQCRAIKLLAKMKEKHFRQMEKIPTNAKLTYNIERLKEY